MADVIDLTAVEDEAPSGAYTKGHCRYTAPANSADASVIIIDSDTEDEAQQAPEPHGTSSHDKPNSSQQHDADPDTAEPTPRMTAHYATNRAALHQNTHQTLHTPSVPTPSSTNAAQQHAATPLDPPEAPSKHTTRSSPLNIHHPSPYGTQHRPTPPHHSTDHHPSNLSSGKPAGAHTHHTPGTPGLHQEGQKLAGEVGGQHSELDPMIKLMKDGSRRLGAEALQSEWEARQREIQRQREEAQELKAALKAVRLKAQQQQEEQQQQQQQQQEEEEEEDGVEEVQAGQQPAADPAGSRGRFDAGSHSQPHPQEQAGSSGQQPEVKPELSEGLKYADLLRSQAEAAQMRAEELRRQADEAVRKAAEARKRVEEVVRAEEGRAKPQEAGGKAAQQVEGGEAQRGGEEGRRYADAKQRLEEKCRRLAQEERETAARKGKECGGGADGGTGDEAPATRAHAEGGAAGTGKQGVGVGVKDDELQKQQAEAVFAWARREHQKKLQQQQRQQRQKQQQQQPEPAAAAAPPRAQACPQQQQQQGPDTPASPPSQHPQASPGQKGSPGLSELRRLQQRLYQEHQEISKEETSLKEEWKRLQQLEEGLKKAAESRKGAAGGTANDVLERNVRQRQAAYARRWTSVVVERNRWKKRKEEWEAEEQRYKSGQQPQPQAQPSQQPHPQPQAQPPQQPQPEQQPPQKVDAAPSTRPCRAAASSREGTPAHAAEIRRKLEEQAEVERVKKGKEEMHRKWAGFKRNLGKGYRSAYHASDGGPACRAGAADMGWRSSGFATASQSQAGGFGVGVNGYGSWRGSHQGGLYRGSAGGAQGSSGYARQQEPEFSEQGAGGSRASGVAEDLQAAHRRGDGPDFQGHDGAAGAQMQAAVGSKRARGERDEEGCRVVAVDGEDEGVRARVRARVEEHKEQQAEKEAEEQQRQRLQQAVLSDLEQRVRWKALQAMGDLRNFLLRLKALYPDMLAAVDVTGTAPGREAAVKLLRTARIRCHPDKVPAGELQAKVRAEEVAKILNGWDASKLR